MSDALLSFHEEQMEKMSLPKWIKDIECPFCNRKISLRAVRNVQLCLNARNFGEIAIEVFCDDCKKMDTVYFRTQIDTIAGFVKYLKGRPMEEEQVLEEKMYKMNYNNVLHKMMTTKKEESHGSI